MIANPWPALAETVSAAVVALAGVATARMRRDLARVTCGRSRRPGAGLLPTTRAESPGPHRYPHVAGSPALLLVPNRCGSSLR